MSKFQVGEIAIYAPEAGIGGECEIVETPRNRFLLGRWWHDLYLMRFAGSKHTVCELYLRKKPNDDYQTTTWDHILATCGSDLNPNKETV